MRVIRNFRTRARYTAAIGLIGLCGLVACQPTATPTPAAANPRDLLDRAGQTIQQTKSVKIKLQVSGAPTFVNTIGAGLVQFLSADGEYLAPGSVSATVKAKLLGIAGQVDIIAIGDTQWYRNAILTGGKFVNSTFAPGFNAQQLVSSDQGIQSALKSVTDLTLIGQENQFGATVYHLAGKAPGSKVTALTVGLIQSNATVDIDVYVDTTTLRAIDVVLTQPETITAAEPNPTRWDLELYDYDVPVTITPPPDAISAPSKLAPAPTSVQPATAPATAASVPGATDTIPVPPPLAATATLPVPTDVPVNPTTGTGTATP
ncbi:MAG: LppX_LprAFG lipoprotein [Aggregatilineales bacterium]